VSRLPQSARIIIAAIIFATSAVSLANAGSLRAGTAAFAREDYVRAADILGPLADRGNAVAQFYLAFMYANGRGVQQNYAEAAMWAHRAAEQGNPAAQYMLGLLHDKGQGVPVNWVEAHKWLNLAASHAPPKDRAAWVRVRDAVASKMSVGQLAAARQLALEWRPTPER
jgi:TPR repeat protein